ncbi:MAG: acyl-CoA reductase [Planctomycetota bacterium]
MSLVADATADPRKLAAVRRAQGLTGRLNAAGAAPRANALTAFECRRLSDLMAVAYHEAGITHRRVLYEALAADAIYPAAQLVSLHFRIFVSWFGPHGVLADWLTRFPRRLRQRASRLRLGHLLPGNHPGAVVSALLPGFLLGCRQIARPSPRLAHFTAALTKRVYQFTRGKPPREDFRPLNPEELAYDPIFDAEPRLPKPELRRWDHRAAGSARHLEAFLRDCDVVTVQGSDFTVEAIRAAWQKLPIHARPHLIAFPHRLSLIAVDCDALAPRADLRFRRPDTERIETAHGHSNAEAVARHASQNDQRGCLNPHGIFLIGAPPRRAAWRKALAIELARSKLTPLALSVEERLAIGYQHRIYAELSRAQDSGFAVQEFGRGDRAARLWSVPPTEAPLALTGRSFYLWEADTPRVAARAMAAWRTPLQAIGCFPDPASFARPFARLQSWVCTLGQLAWPPVDWPQDGCDLLRRLIRLAGDAG